MEAEQYFSARAAGIVRQRTPLDYLHRYWRKVSPEDRLRFLTVVRQRPGRAAKASCGTVSQLRSIRA